MGPKLCSILQRGQRSGSESVQKKSEEMRNVALQISFHRAPG